MAPKSANLAKIGKEGFDIIDKFFAKHSSNHHHNPPANESQIHRQRYQPQEPHTYYQSPQEPQTAARVTRANYYQPQPPQDQSYTTSHQPKEAHTSRASASASATKGYYYPPQEAHAAEEAQIARIAYVALAYGTEATRVSSRNQYYEAPGNTQFVEYERPSFRMNYN